MRYGITLGAKASKDLEDIATLLGITKEEAFRRALLLLKHAADADKVLLVKGEKKQLIRIR